MEQLHHNGVLIPPRYKGRGLIIKIANRQLKLTPEQEEMVLAWAKKMGTQYVKDSRFCRNFHRDFSKKLGIKVEEDDVDYSEILSLIEKERHLRENLSKQEKKRLAAQRKEHRIRNKERYGYAWVDGVRSELANYVAEPSSIFMGRGKHPLRGRWKEGPRQEDVELNLSPDARRPPGNWKNIVWQPDATWIARWRDKLTLKMKYIWFSDSSVLKQNKDIEKFDKAKELGLNLAQVRKHIWNNLEADDVRRKKIATVCFLIDALKIRVGDEKDPDEVDTVGASTLRREHIKFNDDNTVTFDFLGKDSIPHTFRVELPDEVTKNLVEFATNSGSTLFDGVNSKQVSEFLDEVMTGLSAKVFRTFYASEIVESEIGRTTVKLGDPEYVKRYAAEMANLAAAKICNHHRTIPKTWEASLRKKKDRVRTLMNRAKESQVKIKQKIRQREEKYMERLGKAEEKLKVLKKKQNMYQEQIVRSKEQGKSAQALREHVGLQRKYVNKQRERIETLKSKHAELMQKLRQRLASRKQRDKAAIDRLKLKIETQKKTKGYNLNTSLKSYIDPRIYYEWGKRVDYDWKRYYSRTLQRKFSWIENDDTLKEKSH